MFCSTLYSVFDILLLCASDGLILHALVHRISALTRLVGRQVGHPACKNRVVGAGVVVCQEQGADLHMAPLMPLLLTVSCFKKIQIGFTFLVSADLGSPGQRAVKRVCVCVCVCVCVGPMSQLHAVIFTARCYACAVLAMGLCPSVSVSVTSRCFIETAERIELFLACELPSTGPALC